MNKRIIKKKVDLPNWFKNKKYEMLSDPIAWAVEIKRRLQFENMMFFLQDKDIDAPLLDAEFITSIESSLGIPSCDASICYSDTGEIVGYPRIIGSIENQKAVSDISIWDVVHFSAVLPEWGIDLVATVRDLNEAKTADLEACKNEPIPESWEFAVYREKVLDTLNGAEKVGDSISSLMDGFHNPYESLASYIQGEACTVDLNLDDKTLTKSFLEWVKISREKGGYIVEDRKAPLTKNIYLEWNRYKILQVFDLDFWSAITGIRITDALIARVLWPDHDIESDGFDPVSRLRQVTRKSKIPNIISRDMLSRIKGHISNEIKSEKKEIRIF